MARRHEDMTATAAQAIPHPHATTRPAPADEPSAARKPFLKVYLASEEKAAFMREAEAHGQEASVYARFILRARTDPLLFLQLARLLHPGFASGLMGNPTDAGRVAELEKQVLTLTHERDDAARERDAAEGRAAKLEDRLHETQERVQSLAAYTADLMRAAAGNAERAMQTGATVEDVPRATLLLVKALSIAPGLRRKELEGTLEGDGLSAREASEAVIGAERLGLVVKGKDGRYRLAKQPTEDEAE